MMPVTLDNERPTGLWDFAIEGWQRWRKSRRPSTERLAELFADYFNVPHAASLGWLLNLCRKRLETEVEYRDMPPGVKGFHHYHDEFRSGKPIIVLPRSSSDFQTRITLLHELGEICDEYA